MGYEDIKVFTCKVCGYEWTPRGEKEPRQCANRECGSPNWRTGKGKRPPIAEQRIKSQLKKQSIAQINAVDMSQLIPITDAERTKAMRKWNGFIKLDESDKQTQMRVRTLESWSLAQKDGHAATNICELMNFEQKTDELLRVDSSEDEGMALISDEIWPGDIIHFRRDEIPENGDIVLARGFDLDGQPFTTVKHFYQGRLQYKGESIVELRPSNHSCTTIQAFLVNLEIVGVCVNVLSLGRRQGRKQVDGPSIRGY